MTIDAVNALIGRLIHQGQLSLEDKGLIRITWILPGTLWFVIRSLGLFPEWTLNATDPRGRITVNQLLHMSSGLRWTEFYFGLSEATGTLHFMSNSFLHYYKLLRCPRGR